MLNRIPAIAFAMFAANTCFAQGPFNVGTIHPGDSIVIYYDVTINNPLVPDNAVSISNQGTVKGNNFADVPTDDPASPTAGDATVLLLNTSLPVVFSEFKAYQREHSVALTWKIITEENTLKYEVERSADAKSFSKIGEVMATGGDGTINYGFTDEVPFSGHNYYRLKVLDLDATFSFTRIVRVSLGEAGSESNLYPNPVTGKEVNLELLNLAKGQYDLKLINTSGQVIYTKKVLHPGGSASQLITIPEHVASGIYSAEIKGANMRVYKKLVIN
ncbi:T9SS type A sorting domain-containing protein [Dyadobacter sp. CY323]|uniref:T9SS type A sorting domain-containing protein n=1 Tax=Dyadobacter sp. CY323 TaxID=2907302 RepID=UPI001F2B27F0|nr:T9SS type A sorting domain-containing protein [Dyadobacter sp. CY323]MCE6989745.1 T9SS type A sorting domain-containing protein [Dyadobacter sp. CY323]